MTYKKYLILCASAFVLGGILLGWVTYSYRYSWTYCFFVALSVESIVLALAFKTKRSVIKAALVGFLGCLAIVGIINAMKLWALFALRSVMGLSIEILDSSLRFLLPFLKHICLVRLVSLEQNYGVGSFWLLPFLFATAFGFFYALCLRLKIWSLIWRAGFGLIAGSLIGPLVGRLIGGFFNSVLVSYLVAFTVLNLIFGLFFAVGLYNNIAKNE